ncbi:MAG: ScyD/ScyE family protein [Acidobacteria bacterium]|nr:ScyD/ScyE family protein [Acidobacteriota bacterium]
MSLSFRSCALVAAFSAGVVAAPTSVFAQPSVQVIATALDNPRGLALGPDGNIYVVEAGRGGTSTLCLPNPEGPGTICYGASGAVTRITSPGVQARVLTGLPSLATPSGDRATGPHDIAFGFGNAYIIVGSGGDPAALAPFRTANIPLGMILQVSLSGQVTPVVDMAAYEGANNPDGGAPDSNIFGLELLADRGIVADAGANAVLGVSATGAVSTLAVLPSRTVPGPGGDVQMQAVPTSMAVGPDGSIYVAELTGFPFPEGGARIYRVPAAGGTPVMVADGFTNIIDIAIGPDGAAYVLEHDIDGILAPGTTGRLTKIGLFGIRTELATGLLNSPNKMMIGANNTIYVTTNSTIAGAGEVVRITQ